MSTDDLQKKILDFGVRRPVVLSPRGAEILRKVQALTQHRMETVASSVFQQVDDALFDYADRAGASGAQQQFFDGMREIRRKRKEMEDRFRSQIDVAFTDYAAGRKLAATGAPAELSEGEPTLALLDESELEESLALTSMAQRAEQHVGQQLHDLNRRLASLFGREEADELTPVSPRVICQAFVSAVRELDVSVQIRVILLKLLERQLVTAQESTCDDANRLLVEAGVLPTLRHRPSPRKEEQVPGSAMPGIPLAETSTKAVATEIAQEVYAQLQGLLAARRAASHGLYSPSGMFSEPELSGDELLHALTLLQSESNKIGVAPVATARELKQAVVAQASRIAGAQRSQRMRSNDEDAIDLVGMLFEFLIEDRQLPNPIQSMLTRLQLPFLRAALLDRQLFSHKAHPARRLLDALADAGVGWSENADKDQRLFNKMHEVVETLLGEFSDDVAVFDRLNEDFSGFVTTHKRRAELAEQRAAEAARGREKLEAARHEAARVAGRALNHKGLPEIVREVLSGPWTKYLEIVHARRGPESPEWRAATKLVDDLVWSVDRETVLSESKHWAAMLPSIDATLKQGLGAVGFHEADTHRVLAKLRETYAGVMESARMGGSASVGGIVPTSLDGAANEDPADDPTHAELLDPFAAGAQAPELAPFIASARGLRVGQWLELAQDQAGPLRAKLSWVSAITHRYLFVNQNGLKVAEMTLVEVATDLQHGRMRVLEDNPLFDRALSAIVKRLRSA
ncbi:MAG TPA: DUF1631 domain-containing protein [Candidatus Saccharimonadia bacterium]|nr:DUF1631 domain-containing protein [Candidatus Saccharimonadia bacterium]